MEYWLASAPETVWSLESERNNPESEILLLNWPKAYTNFKWDLRIKDGKSTTLSQEGTW